MTGAVTAAERLPRRTGGIIIALCIAEIFGMAGFSSFAALLPGFSRDWGLSNTEAGWRCSAPASRSGHWRSCCSSRACPASRRRRGSRQRWRRSRTRTALPCERGISPGALMATAQVTPTSDLT